MAKRFSTKIICCVVLFVLSFTTRYFLVDRYYDYSFEPDSRRCVEETKSFYFYFQHPVKENFPDPLNTYPNYSDGDYIFSALLANVLRPVFKSEVVASGFSDADNTLLIFSMRWCGVLFDATATVFTFLLLLMITRNVLLSFFVTLFYYVFNTQTLNVDLIRIDHYILFSAAFVMWSALSLFYFPEKKKFYILCGISAGLVTATKINFPFHLLILAVVLVILIIKKQLSLSRFFLLSGAFVLTSVFMYQRWLMYPENIYPTIMTTLKVGKEWFAYWGNKNYLYYWWGQFFNHGFSYGIVAFLLVFYGSFFYTLTSAFRQRTIIYFLLCGVFAVQMLLLTFSPKVGRYGVIVPVWVSIFIAIGISGLLQHFSGNKKAVVGSIVLLLLPAFTYFFKDYLHLCKQAEERMVSIQETRVAAAATIQQMVKDYSIVGIQKPEVSYPPVFENPFEFTSEYLQFPFLDKEALSKFYPPDWNILKQHFNYVMISNKEQNVHLSSLQQYQCDNLLIEQWASFYDSLSSHFAAQCFTSEYENYSVNRICVYQISDSLFYKGISAILSQTTVTDSSIILSWSYNYPVGFNAYSFQVQLSEDSLMRWLVYGSRNGIASKYRSKNNPIEISAEENSFVPYKIRQALNAGKFDFILSGLSTPDRRSQIESFFRGTLTIMKENNCTFQQAMHRLLRKEVPDFFALIKSLYEEDILQMHINDYLQTTQLSVNMEELNSNHNTESKWDFRFPLKLEKGKTYYWRVRSKDGDRVMSRWSNTASFKID